MEHLVFSLKATPQFLLNQIMKRNLQISLLLEQIIKLRIKLCKSSRHYQTLPKVVRLKFQKVGITRRERGLQTMKKRKKGK
jgi:hypothetical protein